MRVLVTGARGLLGSDVVARFAAEGHEVTGAGSSDLDITDPHQLAAAVPSHDAVVNCAAWTAVDEAEAHEAASFAVNALAAGALARAAAAAAVPLVHVSTDYVMDGSADQPYPEDAAPGPRSAYGRTKLAGEWAVRSEHPGALVLRTAWLYGGAGACFPRTIARKAAETGAVIVVDDQVGQPTWTADVARVLEQLLTARAPAGTYHATAAGHVSWYGFAREVVRSVGLDPASVVATSSTSSARPAPRPRWSVLGCGAARAAGVEPIGPWLERWEVAAREVIGPRGVENSDGHGDPPAP